MPNNKKTQGRKRGPAYPESFKMDLVKKWTDGDMRAVEIEAEYGVSPAVLSRWRDRLAFQKPGAVSTAVHQGSAANAEQSKQISDLKDKLLNEMMLTAQLRTRITELEALLSERATVTSVNRRKN